MRTLTPVLRQPGDAAVPTARVMFKSGREIWACDDFEELSEAMDDHAPFMGHEVVGLKPRDIIINPSAVASVARAE
jgi:hypothetical protein